MANDADAIDLMRQIAELKEGNERLRAVLDFEHDRRVKLEQALEDSAPSITRGELCWCNGDDFSPHSKMCLEFRALLKENK